MKKLKDGLDSFVSAAREDLAAAAREEIAILEKYLPAQMSEEELEKKVRAKLAELGITDMASVGKAGVAVIASLVVSATCSFGASIGASVAISG